MRIRCFVITLAVPLEDVRERLVLVGLYVSPIIDHLACVVKNKARADACCAEQFSTTFDTNLIVMVPPKHHLSTEGVALTQEWTLSDTLLHLSERVRRKGARKFKTEPVRVLIGSGIMEALPDRLTGWQFRLLHKQKVKAENTVKRLTDQMISWENDWVSFYHRSFWEECVGECVRNEAGVPGYMNQNICSKVSCYSEAFVKKYSKFISHWCVYLFYLFTRCVKVPVGSAPFRVFSQKTVPKERFTACTTFYYFDETKKIGV